jgi:NNP family nitrate/nitrite transporter-like MFS transporter
LQNCGAGSQVAARSLLAYSGEITVTTVGNGLVSKLVNAIRRGHWPSLLGAWLHFEVSFLVWLLIGALGVAISDEFGLTATEKGLLVAVPILGGALLRIPIGLCSDRYGAKRIGVLLLLGELGALYWGWTDATSYRDLLGVGLLLGMAGASFAVAMPIASQAYPLEHRGFAMGVAASANSGTVLAAFFAPRLARAVGWHAVFGIMLLPVMMVLVLFMLLVKDRRPAPTAPEQRSQASFSEFFTYPSAYWFCLAYAVTFGGFVGLCSFLPIFLHDQYGLDLVAAGTVAAGCGLAGSLVRPIGGYLADSFSALGLLRGVFIGIMVLAVLSGQLFPLPWALFILIGTVTFMGCGNGVIFRLVSDRFPRQMGLASGVIGAAGALGGFLLPTWLGLLKDLTGTYMSGFLVLAGASLFAVASATIVMNLPSSLTARRKRIKV